MRISGCIRALRGLTGEWIRGLQELRYRPGRRLLGNYRIVRRLGMGSYGVAYLCEDTRSGKPCVVKRISPLRGGSGRAASIFQTETEALAGLPHAGLPALLDKGADRGHPVIVMTYVRGDTLEELLFRDDRTFAEDESLQIVRKLLEVLSDIHRSGFVHRDIGIANILLDGGNVRIVDFGLARRLKPSGKKPDDDLTGFDGEEKRLRRLLHPAGDLYGAGHVLLYLLYSGYTRHGDAEERSWEEELELHPETKKLLRRLLMTEQPYSTCEEALIALDGFFHSSGK